MKIVFIGQKGLPGLLAREAASDERRVEVMARHFASQGHSVRIYAKKDADGTSNYHGVKVVKKRMPEAGADIYHVNGWRAAIWGIWLRFWNSEAVLVWTVSDVPQNPNRRLFEDHGRQAPRPPFQGGITRLLRFVAAHYDAVTTPSRTIQYRLLNEYGLYSQYIPDGYYPPMLQDVPLKAFKLKKGQYNVVLADSLEKVKETAEAYAKAGKRRKLVVLQEKKLLYRYLKRKYRFLEFAGDLRGRSAMSVLRNASFVIINGKEVPAERLLQIMDSGRAIIASNEPLNQEILGVAARYYTAGDSDGLSVLLTKSLSNAAEQKKFGVKALNRAKRHLRWQRIMPEYEAAYQAVRSAVPMDSAVVACKVPEMS